jgi:integrase
MASEKLTALQVARAKAPGALGDGKGLYLNIAVGGTKSWIFRFTIAGRAREMGLGSLDDVPLAKARELARACRLLCKEGIDPIEERRARRAAQRVDHAHAITFRECAIAYLAAHRPGWKSARHAAQWLTTLETYAFPVLGSLPVVEIDVALVMRVLEQPERPENKNNPGNFWKDKPESASRVRGRIEAVLDWAAARKYRQGDNPARWKGQLEFLLAKTSKLAPVKHYAAVAYVDIPAFIGELRQQSGVAARALEFTVLTAARSSEAIGARWPEIAADQRLWTIPFERTKSGKTHRVPLSDAAMAIVEEMLAIRHSEFVFPSGRTGRRISSMAMPRVLRQMGRTETVHGFRSTFRSWAAERTNFPRELAEQALSHAVGDAVERAYQRGDLLDRRRRLMEAWARFCAEPKPAGRIVPLERPA